MSIESSYAAYEYTWEYFIVSSIDFIGNSFAIVRTNHRKSSVLLAEPRMIPYKFLLAFHELVTRDFACTTQTTLAIMSNSVEVLCAI